jgi:hypothetical protein
MKMIFNALLYVILLLPLAPLHAQPDRINPQHPNVYQLKEFGRIVGTITRSATEGGGESFGNEIYPLLDINNDGLMDWAVSRLRIDTVFGVYRYAPLEVLVYKGVKDGIPTAQSGERIGPKELGTITKFLAAGDWDGDGHRDIALTMRKIDDTSFGNTSLDWDPTAVVIMWGNVDGHFSLDDTTHLECGAQTWQGNHTAVSADFTGDGIDDLIINGYYGLSAGALVKIPAFLGFSGQRDHRWGRNGLSQTAVWQWWSALKYDRLAVGDQNSDDAPDIIFYDDNSYPHSRISVLYGRAGNYPDTLDVETVDLLVTNSRYSLLADITGDHVPELLLNCGSQERVKIFVGLRGQRLAEQFGSGNDAPQPGEKQWWGKPWASLPMPAALHDAWAPSGFSPLYDLGDANLDGIPDLWACSLPDVIGYVSGERLDSLYDTFIRPPYSERGSVVNLGDIDGSGIPAIAFSYDQVPRDLVAPYPGGVLFLKPSDSVPSTGVYRAVPQGTGPASVEETARGQSLDVELRAVANPRSGEVALQWDGSSLHGSAAITVSDALGQQVAEWEIPARSGEAVWQSSGTFGGVYFITLKVDRMTTTAKVLLR